MLRKQYRCPYFRILVIGRANAGKTTILEKVCGVAKGTQPIIICDKNGKLDESPMYQASHILFIPGRKLQPSETHLMPSTEVSQWFTMNILSDCINLSERHAWYWTSNHIWRKQLYLPWLTRFWVWCKGGDRYCLGLHREAVYCNQAGGSVACNLVESSHSFFTQITNHAFIGLYTNGQYSPHPTCRTWVLW